MQVRRRTIILSSIPLPSHRACRGVQVIKAYLAELPKVHRSYRTAKGGSIVTILQHLLVVLLTGVAPAISAGRLASALLVLFVAGGPAGAVSEFGTRDEAVAMVRRVQEMFKKLGPEATFQAIKRKAPGTIDRDLYAYVVDQNGVVQANGAIPSMTTGTNLYNFRDQNGKYMMREQLEVCKGPQRGWVDFRFLSPLTQTIEDKSTYICLLYTSPSPRD